MFDFTILVLQGAFASSVAATIDLLRTASTVAPRLKLAPPRWRVVAPQRGTVSLGNGMALQASAVPRPGEDRSVWIVPGLGTDTLEGLEERLGQADARRAAMALQSHLQYGGQVASACASVFLLHRAGVLPGRRVTTSWWLAPRLQQVEPRCVVAADRMVCVDGPIITAGAAFAQTDLMLHLLQARFGAPLAQLLRRLLVLDAREAQAPYAIPAMLAGGDELMTRLAARIEEALPSPPSVVALAREFAMSERTLARRVRAASGLTPLALLQGVRLNRARSLIESSRMTIDQVASAVGYEDATALRRMMRRRTGASPSRFRPQRTLA